MHNITSAVPIRVCVIGAGAAGLSCARHLLNCKNDDEKNTFNCKIFEQSTSIGGTWNYEENAITCNGGNAQKHSSMYKHLRTNLPKEVMAFPDFPFTGIDESFIHHTQVQDYLQRYTSHFKLDKLIKFNSIVTSIRPKYQHLPQTPWEITVQDVSSKNEYFYEFDSVMICNGHYSTPHVPDIPGVELFPGTKMHSHDYREPIAFTGKTVAILGASASGLDIAIEISSCAKQVYLSHDLVENIQSRLPTNVIEVTGIISYSCREGFLLRNKESITSDVLIYCTGYEYSFPFIGNACEIQVVNNRVMNLYKHVVNIKYPTMGFIGLPFIVVPFVVIHYQVLFFIQALKNQNFLPNVEEMLKDTDEDFMHRKKLNMPWKYAHKFGNLQWDYISELATLSKTEKLPSVVQKIYEHVSCIRKKQILNYRNLKYHIISENKFICNE